MKESSEEIAFGHFVAKEKSLKSLKEILKKAAPAGALNVSDAGHVENFVRTVPREITG